MIVHALDNAVVFATEEVPVLWILKVIEGSDLNDVVRSVIHVLAFLVRVFGPVAVVLSPVDPAEVFKCVVRFVAVDMVNIRQVVRIRNEVFSKNAMILICLAVQFHLNVAGMLV